MRRPQSLLYAGSDLDKSLGRLGDDGRLDRAVQLVERVTSALPDRGAIKDALSGTWLGHALHPMLSDLPIGFWTSAFMLDLVPGHKYEDAARALVGLGVLSAVPTALAGASDWRDTEGASRRVGAVHALVNSSALALYIGSWRARRHGHRVVGVGLAMGGATLASVGGYLGGHLVDALGVGVDNNAFESTVTEWTRCCDLSSLSERPQRVEAKPGVPVLLVRRGGTALAVSATCPHRGAPLDEGEVAGDVVTCPWHGSEFSLLDGSVQAGPAPEPIRCYDVRVSDGVVELRQRPD